MINKTSAGHGRSIGAGHFDAIRSPDKPGRADQTEKADGRATSFELSGAGSSLTGAIDHMVKQGMPIDMQHITVIRRAIADGQYPVDPTAIADRMIEFDLSDSGF